MVSINFCGGSAGTATQVTKLSQEMLKQENLLAISLNPNGTPRIPFSLPQPITWKPHGDTLNLSGGKTQTQEISSEGNLKTTTTAPNGAKKIVEDLGKLYRITVKAPNGKVISDTTPRKSEEELQKSLHLIG